MSKFGYFKKWDKGHHKIVKCEVENVEFLFSNFEVENFDHLRSNARVNLFHRRRVHSYSKSAYAHFLCRKVSY